MIGERIKYHRKKRGLTLEQLGEGICSVSYLSKIEHGEKSSEEISQLLCQRLNIDYEEIDQSDQINTLNDELSKWYKELISISSKETLRNAKEDLAQKINDLENPKLSLKYNLFLTYFCITMDQSAEAEQLLKHLKLFEDLFDPELNYYYFLFSGILFCNNTHYEKATFNLYKAEDFQGKFNASEDDRGELCYQLARLECMNFRTSKCINYANKSLSFFNKLYNMKRIADCQTLLGIANRRILNYEEVHYHYEQALKFASILKDDQRESILLHNLGSLYAAQDNHKEAIEHFQKSLDLKIQTQAHVNSVVLTLTSLAEENYQLNNIEKTKSLVTLALQLIEHSERSVQYVKLKGMELQLADPMSPLFEEFIRKKVIPLLMDYNMWEDVSRFSEQLADYYFKKNQYKSSSIYYRRANDARKKYNV